MRLARFALLAFATSVTAQSSSICSSDITISSQPDADAISSCDTFSASITIGSSASGSIAIHGIEVLKGSLTADGASRLTGLAASDLDTITGAFTIQNNDALTKVTMDGLTEIQGIFRIENNPQLTTVDGFDDLESVTGSLTFSGDFDSIKLPSLETVRGQASIRSSGSFSCSSLNKKDEDEDEGEGDGGVSYSCSTSTSGLSGGAKAGIAIGVIVPVMFIMFLVYWLTRRSKRRGALKNASVSSTPLSAAAAKEDEEKKIGGSGIVSPVSPSDGVAGGQAQGAAAMSPPEYRRKPVPDHTSALSTSTELDGAHVLEAPVASDAPPVFELDAGPLQSSHQRAINHELSG